MLGWGDMDLVGVVFFGCCWCCVWEFYEFGDGYCGVCVDQ